MNLIYQQQVSAHHLNLATTQTGLPLIRNKYRTLGFFIMCMFTIDEIELM